MVVPKQEAEEILPQILLLGVKDRIQRLQDTGGILFITPQCTPAQFSIADTCDSV